MSYKGITKPLLACGHSAMGHVNGGHFCPICVGIHPGAETVAAEQPNLEGRKSICLSCQEPRPSSLALAFFSYRAERDTDSHYCGCQGWE